MQGKEGNTGFSLYPTQLKKLRPSPNLGLQKNYQTATRLTALIEQRTNVSG